jgi:hypothetical protein
LPKAFASWIVALPVQLPSAREPSTSMRTMVDDSETCAATSSAHAVVRTNWRVLVAASPSGSGEGVPERQEMHTAAKMSVAARTRALRPTRTERESARFSAAGGRAIFRR